MSLTNAPASDVLGSVRRGAIALLPVLGVLACLFALWHFGAAHAQTSRFGDGQEYLTMASSFVRHHSPEWESGDDLEIWATLPRHWRRQLVARHKLTFVNAPQGYFAARSGKYYSYHFFTYPAFVAPLRALLGRRHDAFRAHQYLNLLMLSYAFLSLLQLRPSPRLFWLLAPLGFLTPVLWFSPYAHTESFVFALGLMAASCYLAGRPLLAILFNSIAATQYQPLALLSIAICAQWFWETWRSPAGLRGRVPAAGFALFATALVLVPTLFFETQYGVPNLFVREGFARSDLLSLGKFAGLFFDPDLGLISYAPGVLLLTLLTLYWAVRRAIRARTLWGLALFGAALLAMFSSTCQRNWNHPTFGLSRYALYGLAPLLLAIANEWRHVNLRASFQAGLIALAFGLQLVVHAHNGFFEYRGPDAGHHSSLTTYVLEHWPALYSPPPEVFCERTRPRCEQDFGTALPKDEMYPVIWRDRSGQPRKILTERCDPQRVLSAQTFTPEQQARIRGEFAGCRGDAPFYINL